MSWALRGVSLSLPERGFIAIKGASGSGKSTFLNLASGLASPSEGHLYFQGRDLGGFNRKEKEDYRAFSCGFVYQHFNLLEDLSALENVALPLELRGEEEKAATQKAKTLLAHFGLAPLQDKRAKTLSGGEKQRVALSRALVGNPKVIFADEPTGALDAANEAIVMTALQEIAKTALVLFVSHNPRLIERYAERVITLEDGKVIGDSAPSSESAAQKVTSLVLRGPHRHWIARFLKRNYAQDKTKNLLSVLAGSLGYLALLLSYGFYHGSNASLAEERKRSLQYLGASLSEKTTFPLEGSPLSLTMSGRPTLEKAQALIKGNPELSIHPDYGYFFPSYSAYSLNGEKEEGASFVPVFDLSLRDRSASFLIEGSTPKGNTLSEALVNREFADLFAESPCGKTITFGKAERVEQAGAVDNLHFSFSLYITGVVEEFSFLNTPKIFYSYGALASFFESESLSEISKKAGKGITIADFVDSCDGHSAYSSYDYLLFAYTEAAGATLQTLATSLEKAKSSLAISSPSLSTSEAFSSLTSSFSASLLPFLGIGIAGVAFIVSSLSYSSFLSRKKEAAIFLALGARNDDSDCLYLGESLVNALFSASLALALSYPLSRLANHFLEKKLGLSSLIAVPYLKDFGIPFFPVIGLFLFSLILSLLGGGIPLAFAKKANLAEELKDE